MTGHPWNSCRCRPGKRPERFWRKNIRIFGARSEIIWRMAYRCIFPMQQEKPRAWGVKYDRYGRKIRINGRRKELRESVRLPACSPVRAAKVTDGPRRDKAKPDGSGKKQHRKGAVFLCPKPCPALCFRRPSVLHAPVTVSHAGKTNPSVKMAYQ